MHTISAKTYRVDCDQLAQQDPDLARIISECGYPPFWDRPNNCETLIHIILEQQVSLASAKAALEKLRARITQITPERVLALNDAELKACYFSRQKIAYTRGLCLALLSGELNLSVLSSLPDDEVRDRLTQLKGIGNWTADIYLIMVLHRPNIFPVGDLAAVHALKQIKSLPTHATREHVLAVANAWQPQRTVATMLLWHFYLSERSARH